MPSWTAVVLAGGASRRMGTPKAYLTWRGETLLTRIAGSAERVFGSVVIVSRDAELEQARALLGGSGSRLVTDESAFQGMGPLAGLYTAMNSVHSDFYFVWACDMPDIPEDYLKGFKGWMEREAQNGEAVVPVHQGQLQPLAGGYRNVSRQAERLLQQGRLRMTDLLAELKTFELSERIWMTWTKTANPFFNMNTPEDWRQWMGSHHET